MCALVIPQEICSRIVQWAKQTELPILCLISKAFLRAAECKLYEHLYIGDPAVSYRACQTIASRDRIALHVRTLWLYQDRRRSSNRGALSPQFWTIVHAALTKTLNLDVLGIADPTYSNSWVLQNARFQLREANLRFTWDAHLAEFLQSQNRMRTLQTMSAPLPLDGGDVTHTSLQPGSLPSLQMYDGPLVVAAELVTSPLTNLQVFLDQESLAQMYKLIPRLAMASKTLRTLSMLEVPEEVCLGIFDLCSTFSPQLRHIGIFCLPISGREKFHHYLNRLSKLQTIELDVTGWTTRPSIPVQRMLAAEIRTYCPSILYVAIWFQQRRVLWSCDNDEGNWVIIDTDGPRAQGPEILWKYHYPR